MDLAERHVVITGAAGGLGPAVVERMLAAGAICHLPVRADADRLPRHARILAVEGVDLTNEAAVTSFYARCPPLWASIHVAGGYNAAMLGDTRLADLRGQLDLNLVDRVPLLPRGRAQHAREGGRRPSRQRQRAYGRRAGGWLGRLHHVEGGGERARARARGRARRRAHPDQRHHARRPSTRPPTARRCPTPIRPSGPSRPTSRR